MDAKKEMQKQAVNSRIDHLKSFYEKGKQSDATKKKPDLRTLNSSNTLKDRVDMYQTQLDEVQNKKEFQNFGELTKKYDIKSMTNESDVAPEELERVRSSIVTKENQDFKAKKSKFEPESRQAPQIGNLSHFIKDAHLICQNYEKEIELLKKQIRELSLHKLSGADNGGCVKTEIDFEILGSPLIEFENKMKKFFASEPSIADITNNYNEKIMDLYSENEKLEAASKELAEEKKKSDSLRKKLKQAENEIGNLNEIYQEKFEQIFQESVEIQENFEILKKQVAAKDKVITDLEDEKIKSEAAAKELSENNYAEIKQNFQKEKQQIMEENKKHLEKLEAANEETARNMLHKSTTEENLKLDLNKILKENKELNDTLGKLTKEKESAQSEIDNLEESLKNIMIEKTSEIEKISKELAVIQESTEDEKNKLLQENTQNLKLLKDELDTQKEERKREEEKLTEENDKLKKETEELGKIIAKDQLTIKGLRHANSLSEQETRGNELLREEIAVLKSEIELFKERLVEESQKIEDRDEQIVKLVEDRDKLAESLKTAEELTFEKEKLLKRSEQNVAVMQEQLKDLNEKINHVNSNNNEEFRSNDELTRELIADSIFYLFLYDNSISLEQLINLSVNNFSLYLGTSFSKHSVNDLSYSVIHEFLGDSALKIYDIAIKKKMEKLKTSKKMDKEEIWILNELDVDLETSNEICKKIQSSNVCKLFNSISQKRTKSVDDLIEIFVQKYQREGTNFKKFTEVSVKPVLIKKIEKYVNSVQGELRTLVQFFIKHFHAGKLMKDGKEIYNFQEFFKGYMARDLKDETLFITQILENQETVDNLVYTIKNNNSHLKSIYMTGSFKKDVEFPLERLSVLMMTYCPRLKNLSITESPLSQTQLRHIIKLIDSIKTLEFVDLSANCLGDEGIYILCEGLKDNKHLHSLYLNKNEITSRGTFYLADCLMKNSGLEKLCLGGNNVNDSGLSSMATVLTYNNKYLKQLDLSGNELNDKDFSCLAELLQKGKTLKILNISGNKIDSPSANMLGSAIKHTALSVLYIENTSINEESAPLLFNTMAGSKLAELYLDNNLMGEVGGIVLTNVLKHNTHMKFLSMRKCGLTSMFLSIFCKLLQGNCSLEGINLEENAFDDDSVGYLKKTLDKEAKNVKVYLSSSCLTRKSQELLNKNKKSFIL